jgi:hypothetical protein
MSISTTSKEPTSAEKIAALREKHQPIFNAYAVSNALFYPKMVYKPKGKDELYVSFWASELRKGDNIYTEFVDREYNSEDIERNLWLWRYNPHWEEEYEQTEPNTIGHVRYLVPVSELIKVNLPDEKVPFKQTTGELDISQIDTSDPSVSEMTMRDFVAIMTGKPVSNKAWLNEIIKK